MERLNEWLKDKKNLPIVIGIAVAVLVISGGLMALEMGLFGGSAPTPLPPALMGRGGPTPSGPGSGSPTPPSMPPGPPPGMMAGPMAMSRPPVTANAKTAAVPAAPIVVDPAHGPNPFNIPGGQKRMASILTGGGKGSDGKTPIRDILPPFNLFHIQPPSAAPLPPDTNNSGLQAQAARIVVSGIINGGDGISAILEVNGESQSVKPGDSLLDGSKVISIQPTSVTVRSPDGATTPVPLTSGAGDQSPNVQDQNGQYPNNQYQNGGQPFNGPPMQPQPFGG